MAIIEFLEQHSLEIIGLLIALFGIVIPFFQYILVKKAEERDKRFTNFHNLIKHLVQSDDPAETIKLDRQVAVVFELRRLPDYYPVTKRILIGLRQYWGSLHLDDTQNARILTEIDLTIKHIDDYNKKWHFKKIKME